MAGISAELTLEIAQFRNAIKQAQSAVNGFSSKAGSSGTSGGISLGKGFLGGIAGILTGAAVQNVLSEAGAAIKSFMSGAIKGAASDEQLQIRFEALTGDKNTATDLLDELRKRSEATGAGIEDMANSMTKFIANGLDPAQAVKLNTSLMDIAGTLGMSAAEANLLGSAVAQVKSKGVASMEELRQQIAEKGVPIFQALADSIGVSVPELNKMIAAGTVSADAVLDVFTNLTGGFAKFRGGAERNANTLNGMFARIKQAWSGLMRDFGKPVMESLKPIFDSLIFAIKSMQKGAAGLGQDFARVVDAVGDIMTSIRGMSWGDLGKAFRLALEVGAIEAINFLNTLGVAMFAAWSTYIMESFKVAAVVLQSMMTPDFWAGLASVLLEVAKAFAVAIVQRVVAGLTAAVDAFTGRGSKAEGGKSPFEAIQKQREAGMSNVANSFTKAFAESRDILKDSAAKAELASLFETGKARSRAGRAGGGGGAFTEGGGAAGGAAGTEGPARVAVGGLASAVNLIMGRSANELILVEAQKQGSEQKKQTALLQQIAASTSAKPKVDTTTKPVAAPTQRLRFA